MTGQTPALELRDIHAGYAELTVLRDVSLSVPRGSIVALLGPNGAGKTTLLRTASGLIRPDRGTVVLNGVDVTRLAPNQRAKQGLCLIPEGRGIFRGLTVRENLRMQIPQGRRDVSTDEVLELFPVLRDRLGQLAGTMSGGQQQMLALARAYLAKPDLVLLDEVSMGLAPNLVDEIFQTLRHLAATGVSMLLVEQYVSRAIEMADEVVLLDRGSIGFAGPASGLDESAVLRGYLGIDDVDVNDRGVPAG
ncbi:MAG TPA: ABC transporter ATP-binding protein [Nocardioides sp.]|uniref:ABC transporter ATP-binding protein n=1 Tax=uncultured Nocardioides sp. TaxID=198441 RepID=UPI000EB86BC5|nr:ABC transporter ATP-binding protein [uncultured Nocardioides sp.]HCB05114.1 ABC transporter ATP-binding protein [Nocardioides sp.]HRD59969.1 ABC transporter ATP-binding protein [Nocardioides sp.]HRI94147.1 ABC transporter ATP-binding protein [Nocardioides sp.]HRK44189.1 ABC transporter ATP-binding protein [Nocardioides sp.]